MYSAFEEAVKPNRGAIKLSQWSARYLARWMNAGVHSVHPRWEEKKGMKHIWFDLIFFHTFLRTYHRKELFREGLQRSLRLNANPATRGLTAPHGLRPPLTSSVLLGGSVRQDQHLDIRQVHITSPAVRPGSKRTILGTVMTQFRTNGDIQECRTQAWAGRSW